MASNIAVSIGADTTQLTAQLAVARADLSATSAELRKVAQAMREAGSGASDDLKASLSQSATAAASAQTSVAKLRAELDAARPKFDDLSNAGEHQAGVFREKLIMAHEALMGNYTRLGGSMMVLAERTGGLGGALAALVNPTTLTIGAFVALGGAAFEAIRKMEGMTSAIRQVAAATAVSGLSAGGDQIRGLIKQIGEMGDVSTEEATKIVADFARIKGASVPEIQALGAALNPLSRSLGVTVPEAAKMMAGAFADPTQKGHAFLDAIGAGVGALDDYDKAIRSGGQSDGLRIMAAQLKAFSDRVVETNPQLIEGLGLMERWQLRQQTLDQGLDATMANMARVKLGGDFGAAMPTLSAKNFIPLADIRTQAEELRSDLSRTNAQIAADTLAFWQRQRAGYVQAGQQTTEIDKQIATAKVDLARQTSAEIIAQTQAETQARVQAAGGDRAAALRAEVSGLQAELASERISAEAKIGIRRDLVQKEIALSQESRAAELRGLEQLTAATRAGSTERLRALTNEYEAAQRLYGVKSPQADAVMTKTQPEILAAVRQQEQIEREQTNTQIQLGQLALAAKKDDLDAEVAAHKMTAQQEIAILQQKAEDQYRLEHAALVKELGDLADEPVKYQQVQGQIEVLAERHTVAMAAYSRQIADANKRDAEQTKVAWDEATGPITRAFDGMVSGVLQGTQSIGQAARRAAGNLVISFAEAFASMTAKAAAFFAFNAVGWQQLAGAVNPFQGQGIGGMVGKATGLGQAAGGSGGSAATTANTTAVHALTSQVTALNSTMGGQTTATAANTTSTDANATSTNANSLSTDANAVSTDANATSTDLNTASSEEGIFSTIANTVATEANTIAAYIEAAMAAFDVGTSNVPHDMVAQIHKGEIIVPAAQSAAIRGGQAVLGFPTSSKMVLPTGAMTTMQALSSPTAPPGSGTASAAASGSAGGGGGGGGNLALTIHAMDGQSVIAALSTPQVQKFLARSTGAYNANNPSTRGTY